MAAYAGKDLSIVWTAASGGTITMQADFKTLNYTPSVDLYETTAGADAAKTYLAGLKSGQVAFNGVDQSGSMVTWSTALLEGQEGTLVIGPEGTVAGKRKLTIPAICMGANMTWPYNNICELAVNWTQNGVRTDGVF
jgi:hypothetical protein